MKKINPGLFCLLLSVATSPAFAGPGANIEQRLHSSDARTVLRAFSDCAGAMGFMAFRATQEGEPKLSEHLLNIGSAVFLKTIYDAANLSSTEQRKPVVDSTAETMRTFASAMTPEEVKERDQAVNVCLALANR